MDLSPYWKIIVDTLQDGVIVVDPSGNIVAVNPAATKLIGYDSKELIGQSCRILHCTGCHIYAKGTAENWCRLFKVGGVRTKRCTLSNKNRQTINIVKRAAVLRDDRGTILGAVETLKDMSEVVRQQEQILFLRKSLSLEEGYHGIVGKAPVMQRLYELIENVGMTEAPVLITGESGTGKELVARAIHEVSPRHNKPFIKINCASLNENLLESELFGHAKGAYTGADRARIGRFEAAHQGTIFLDEIGDIPLSTQVKLLRVLEEKEVERVGEYSPVKVDVRVVSATNRRLGKMVADGLFREDLYFRINVFPLVCPPLRERSEDIPAIVQSFIRTNASKCGKKILGLTPEAMEKLIHYDWPGNVRELRNSIEYAFVLCPSGGIDVRHLPPKIAKQPVVFDKTSETSTTFTVDKVQKDALVDLLRETGGNQSEAARRLGVSRITIWKRIKKYGINIKRDVLS
jgi:PAS domain S-box-containing protein